MVLIIVGHGPPPRAPGAVTATAAIGSVVLGATLAGGVATMGTGAMALSDGRHLPRRYLITTPGMAASLAVAVLAADALLGGARAAAWRMALGMLAQATLAQLFVLLIAAVRRADRATLKVRAGDVINQQTSLPNRTTLIGQALPALARCQRDQSSASVIAAAVDGAVEEGRRRDPFAADRALREFANVFREATRAGDLPGHATPAVLAALLPTATPESAWVMAERLRRDASTRVPHPAMGGRRLTVGVGTAPGGDGPTRAVLDEAFSAARAALAAARPPVATA